nr:MAG TPA: hypothetical protein [Caudoviricetes sp.]
MDNECLVRLTTVREWCSDGRNDNEMYTIITSDGSGCDVNLSYNETVAIHELTGRVIREREKKEVHHG